MMTQKELKALYKEELKKAWNDEKMVDFCSRKTAYVIDHNNALYGIEKPKIETDFCFGYGMYGMSTDEDYDRADRLAQHARESEEYFIEQNLENLNRWIKNLNDISEDMQLNWANGNYPHYMIETGKHYYGQSDDCKLNYYAIVDTYRGNNQGELCKDLELIKKLIEGYEVVKKDFTKRLNTYLKRYGLTKINSWSYLVD